MANETFTKHTQTVLVSLATAAIGWLAFSVEQNTIKVAVLIDKVDKLEHRAYAVAYEPVPIPVRQPAYPPIQEYPTLPVSMPEPRRK
jgi:hypothetical protein